MREAVSDRKVHLLLENEENEAALLERDLAGTPLTQSNGTTLLHVAATGEGQVTLQNMHANGENSAALWPRDFQGDKIRYRGAREVSAAIICRRQRSSALCKTMIRSATGLWVSG